LVFLGNYGIWVGLVLLMLAALTFLARRDQRIYQDREQSQQRLKAARKKFKLLKPSSQLLPEDLGYQRREPGQPVSQERRPFFETYIPRLAIRYEQRTEVDTQPLYGENALARLLQEGRGFVLLGPPLDGKSRTLFEIVKSMEGYLVTTPHPYETVPDDRDFSLLLKDQKVVLLLDDLTKYAQEDTLNLQAFVERLREHASSWAVASTCRDGSDLISVRNADKQSLGSFYDTIPLKLFLIEASSEDKGRLAESIGKRRDDPRWEELPSLGQIVMEEPMRDMKARFDRLSYEQQDILRGLKLLVAAGIPTLRRDRLKAVLEDEDLFERQGIHLRDQLRFLAEQSFLQSVSRDRVEPEPAYLQYVVTYAPGRTPLEDFEALADVLESVGDSEGLLYLGISYSHTYAQFEQALEAFNSTLEIKADYAPALHNKGKVLGNLGRHAEALEAFNSALEIKPDYAPALANKGFALALLGRHEEAIEAYRAALEISPAYAGRPEKAIEAYDAGLGIKPDHADALYKKGNALADLERYEEAIKAYDAALQLRPEDADALYKKGIALAELERHEEALE